MVCQKEDAVYDSTAACIIIEGDRRKPNMCNICFVAPLPGADLPTMKNQNREVEQKRNKEWEGKVPPGHAFTGAAEHCGS